MSDIPEIGTRSSRQAHNGFGWIRWDQAEPTQGSYDNAYFALIDEQVLGARARGLRVVLVTWHFPRWSNGTVGLTDADYAGDDRRNPSGSLKPFEQRAPWDQLGVGGAWGRWINALMSRYKGYGGIALEVMNEPNLQMWPQQATDGSLIIHQKAAEMMNTAVYLAAYHGFQMYVAGPAASDYRGPSTRRATDYWWFLWNLRSALEALNQRGSHAVIWTHHNYKDIEDNNTLGIDLVRSVLLNWWRGWSPTSDPSGANPGFFITEGGARISTVGSEAAQNLLVAAGWNRALANPGAGMFTN